VIDRTVVKTATFTVEMATVKSDQGERNAQFDGRIMDVARYPTATFVLTSPISFGSVPAVGKIVTVAAIGDLTMHGVTRKLTLAISTERTTTTIDVLADATIVFADWDIQACHPTCWARQSYWDWLP
jgi:polyisoprenoid-binding protein YceI